MTSYLQGRHYAAELYPWPIAQFWSPKNKTKITFLRGKQDKVWPETAKNDI